MPKYLIDTDALTITPMNTGGPEPNPNVLAIDNRDGTVSLPRTGHRVPIAVLGEGILTYYIRAAASVNGNPGAAGSIVQNGDMYNVGRTGNPVLDMAVMVDAFANPVSYGIGVGSGGGSGVGSGGGVTTITRPTYTGGLASDSLNNMESKAFAIPAGGSLALAVTLVDGSWRCGIGEYQMPQRDFEMSLSRTQHEYEGAPLRGRNAMNCDIGAFPPFTSGPWYLNVRNNSAEDGQFRISYYNQ